MHIYSYNSEYIQCNSRFESKWKHKKFEIDGIRTDEICIENWFEDDEMLIPLKPRDMPYFVFGITKSRDCVGRLLADQQVRIGIATLLLNLKFEFDNKIYGSQPQDVRIKYERGLGKKLETNSMCYKVTRV